MRRFFLLLLVCLAAVPCLRAQEEERFEAGAFADYFRSGATGTNMFGLGGRAGVGLFPHLMLEGEMAYDFNRGFEDAFTNTTTGGGVSFITSGTKTLHGLFGPRWTLQRGRIHPFVEAKLGFINYMFNNEPVGQFVRQSNSESAVAKRERYALAGRRIGRKNRGARGAAHGCGGRDVFQ